MMLGNKTWLAVGVPVCLKGVGLERALCIPGTGETIYLWLGTWLFHSETIKSFPQTVATKLEVDN